ncbi:hypothetical protein T484DRAFT_1790877 [Baffinella frigidus]|nr:hypothetical protein T484DRAFT_1790877 [Cryptophyta sp. CCMP2293]
MDRSIPPSPGNYSPDYGSPGDSPRAASPGAVAGAKSSSPAPIAHTMPKIRELNFSKSVAESLTEALDTSADRRAARGVAGFEPSRSSGDEQSARILRWLKREPGVLSRDLEALRRVRDVCGCYMVRKWDQLDPAKREAMIHSNRFDSLQTFLRSIEGKAFQSEGGISPASVSEFAALAAVASSSDVKHSLHRGPSQRKLASDPVLKECARIISEPQASGLRGIF